MPLNAEQQTAVREALTEPITVITGPPGTGKSQVVTAILVNAAWRGFRVLFASKNNKAVDVVMERMNALSPDQSCYDLASGRFSNSWRSTYPRSFPPPATEEDRRGYESILSTLRAKGEELGRLTTQMDNLIRLRNKVDQLERAAEPARGVLFDETFRNAGELPISDAEARVAELRKALRRSNRETASFFGQLLWAFVEDSTRRRLMVAADKVRATLKLLGFDSTKDANPDQMLVAASELVNAFRAASDYQSALKRLSDTPDPGALASQVAEQSRIIAEVSGEAWSSWTALLPDRLNERGSDGIRGLRCNPQNDLQGRRGRGHDRQAGLAPLLRSRDQGNESATVLVCDVSLRARQSAIRGGRV